jgi:hypothetical protein
MLSDHQLSLATPRGIVFESLLYSFDQEFISPTEVRKLANGLQWLHQNPAFSTETAGNYVEVEALAPTSGWMTTTPVPEQPRHPFEWDLRIRVYPLICKLAFDSPYLCSMRFEDSAATHTRLEGDTLVISRDEGDSVELSFTDETATLRLFSSWFSPDVGWSRDKPGTINHYTPEVPVSLAGSFEFTGTERYVLLVFARSWLRRAREDQGQAV